MYVSMNTGGESGECLVVVRLQVMTALCACCNKGARVGLTFVSPGGAGLHFVGSYVVNCIDSSLDGGG